MKRDKQSLAHRTVGGMLWMAWGKAAYSVLHVLVLAVMARLLTPADFGVVSTALVVISFSAIFSQVGLGPALVQRSELEPRHIDTAFAVSTLFGLLLGALIWLTAPLAAAFFRNPGVIPVLRALAWVFPLQGLGVTAESLAWRELRFRWLANRDVAAYGLGYGVVGIGLALLGWGVWALVAGEIGRLVVRSGILLADRRPNLRAVPERRALGELMYFGGGFTIARVANFLAVQGDNMTVARTLGPTALGLYGRAYSLMAAPATAFGTVMDQVLFPTMARLQDEVKRLAAAYRRGVGFLAVMILPMSSWLFVLAPEVIHTVLGPRWAGVVPPFRILAIGMLFRTSYKMSDSLSRATGSVYRRAWRQIIYAGLVIGGAWIGQHWGIAAVALGVLFALLVNFLLMAELGLSVTRMTWGEFWQAHVPAVALTAATLPVVWGAATVLRHWNLSPVVVLAVAGTLTAGWALLLVRRAPRPFLGSDGLWMLETLRQFVPERLRQSPPGLEPRGSHQVAGAGGTS